MSRLSFFFVKFSLLLSLSITCTSAVRSSLSEHSRVKPLKISQDLISVRIFLELRRLQFSLFRFYFCYVTDTDWWEPVNGIESDPTNPSATYVQSLYLNDSVLYVGGIGL